MNPKTPAEQLIEDLYVCKDPDCEATHVDMDSIDMSKPLFFEGDQP